MNLPIIRIEIDRMRETLLAMLSEHNLKMDEMLQKAVDAFCQESRIKHIIETAAENTLADAIRKEVADFFQYGDGRKTVAAAVKAKLLGGETYTPLDDIPAPLIAERHQPKHAPEPWSQDPEGERHYGIEDGNGRVIAYVCKFDDESAADADAPSELNPIDEVEYNARLIEAAPALLRLMQRALAEIHGPSRSVSRDTITRMESITSRLTSDLHLDDL
jgi:hypothetical protein